MSGPVSCEPYGLAVYGTTVGDVASTHCIVGESAMDPTGKEQPHLGKPLDMSLEEYVRGR